MVVATKDPIIKYCQLE